VSQAKGIAIAIAAAVTAAVSPKLRRTSSPVRGRQIVSSAVLPPSTVTMTR